VIRSATLADAHSIADIYNPYVAETVITFEEHAVSAQDIEERISKVIDAHLPWIVAEQDGEVRAYAYATPWRARAAYRFSVETSVYVDRQHIGKQLGTKLYDELLRRLIPLGTHAAIGGIALPNDQSVSLHERLGFTKVAHFHEVGLKFGRWIDVGYWQRTFEQET
jgi:phosphinothricin acetyltransferase